MSVIINPVARGTACALFAELLTGQTQALVRGAAVAMPARSGAKITVIKDSPGFIAQRMCAMIASLGCEMAMIGITSAQDLDTAMTLGLNYPRGPLARPTGWA
jgi:3-hydroxyacyl-CoA dehydrogenase